jgi:hypothetical protein
VELNPDLRFGRTAIQLLKQDTAFQRLKREREEKEGLERGTSYTQARGRWETEHLFVRRYSGFALSSFW